MCCICGRGAGHSLDRCEKLRAQTHDVKVQLLKDNGICFGCLNKGHVSKSCTRRMTCEYCQGKHPSVLHIHRTPDSNGQFKSASLQQKQSISGTLFQIKEGHCDTGAGRDCKLSIVPVQLRAAKADKTILTYAFLDPGSTATFCTENVMRQLNISGKKTKVLLQTMGQRKPVNSYEISGLQVGDVSGNNFIELEKTYTQTKIPVTKANIFTQTDINKWPYLGEIQIKEIDANVELLIGVDVPRQWNPGRL